MASTVEKVSSNQVKISFEVPAAEFDAAVQKAYLKMRGRVQVPGFRRGHAPRKVIEKKLMSRNRLNRTRMPRAISGISS